MVRGKANSACIVLSDTDEETEEEKEDEYSQAEEDEEETSNSSSSSDDIIELSDDDDDDEEEEEEEEESTDNDENGVSVRSNTIFDANAQYDRIIQLLRGGRDMEPLKLEEYKVYLRKHGLRLTGNKEVCIQRIQEHWRIKDGNGEKYYPRSSFSINCTGDVCKGDVVVFKQRVLGKFGKAERGRNLRTIAGRVVKESYGTAKQQHTFTVEVLWSKGFKKLPPLSPLLVKGRNLYRLRTYRQRWGNESERSKVLAEKHKRGAEARELRARKKTFPENKGSKRKKQLHRTRGVSSKRQRTQEPGSTSRTQAIKAPLYKQANENEIQRTFPNHFRPITEMRIPLPPPNPIHYAYGLPPHHHGSNGHYAPSFPGYRLDPRSFGPGSYRGFLNPNGLLRCPTPGCGEMQSENCVVFSCWRCCRRTGRRCFRHQN